MLKRIIKKHEFIFNSCLDILFIIRKFKIKYFYIETLKKDFKKQLGYSLNLDTPKTFNEKLQWLKVYYKDPIMTKCADKVAVRDIITKEIGKEYLIDVYGVYDSVDEIDISKLPNQFVLKPNHSSGRVIICKDKNAENWKENFKLLKKWMKENYYYQNGEWVYKDIKPKIVCEKLLDSNIVDYKLLCFNGKAKVIFLAKDRGQNVKFNFYDTNFDLLPIKWHHDNFKDKIDKPIHLDLMIQLSEQLSKKFPHVRVDWYEVDNKLYFGELTFFHDNGMHKIEPYEWDYKLGELLDLSKVRKEYICKD